MEVEFNENQQSGYNYSPKKMSIAGLLIRLGLAKNEAGARKVMIVVIILCFALSIYFFYQAF